MLFNLHFWRRTYNTPNDTSIKAIFTNLCNLLILSGYDFHLQPRPYLKQLKIIYSTWIRLLTLWTDFVFSFNPMLRNRAQRESFLAESSTEKNSPFNKALFVLKLLSGVNCPPAPNISLNPQVAISMIKKICPVAHSVGPGWQMVTCQEIQFTGQWCTSRRHKGHPCCSRLNSRPLCELKGMELSGFFWGF